MSDTQQEVIDAYAARGFIINDTAKSENASAATIALLANLIAGEDKSKMFFIDKGGLPNGMKLLAYGREMGLPKTLDETVRIAIFVLDGWDPIEMELQTSAVVFEFVDALRESGGDLHIASDRATALGTALNAALKASLQAPRNEAEAAVIAYYTKRGYQIVANGPRSRVFQKEFDGGWHGVAKPAPDDLSADLPQSLDEPVSTALHLHALRKTVAATANDSYEAIEACEKTLKFRAAGLAAVKNDGALVS